LDNWDGAWGGRPARRNLRNPTIFRWHLQGRRPCGRSGIGGRVGTGASALRHPTNLLWSAPPARVQKTAGDGSPPLLPPFHPPLLNPPYRVGLDGSLGLSVIGHVFASCISVVTCHAMPTHSSSSLFQRPSLPSSLSSSSSLSLAMTRPRLRRT